MYLNFSFLERKRFLLESLNTHFNNDVKCKQEGNWLKKNEAKLKYLFF